MNLTQVVRNAMISRTAWLSKLLDPGRNIEQECGHPIEVLLDDCVRAMRRGDVARRIIRLWPDESWLVHPTVFETEEKQLTSFEEAWDLLRQEIPIYPLLYRADVLSGVGRFGAVLLGLDDGLPLDQPVEMVGGDRQKPTRQLIYLRPFDESVVQVMTLEADPTSPRYGLPTQYAIQFADTAVGGGASQRTVSVHWSRIIHLADNRLNSEVYGEPRLNIVYNRLLDLKKIAGGSGEMFWKGGFPGLSLETHPTLGEDVEVDQTATKEQVKAYMEGLQRYLTTVGMSAKSLTVQVADPGPHLDAQLRLISIAMGVPWRVLVGSEAAQLASEQDTRSWYRRVGQRQINYLSPYVIRPFVDRLIDVGVLPEPAEGYEIHWPDLNTPSETVRAEVADKQTSALTKYTQSGVDALVPPFHYLTLVLGLSDDEARAVIKAAEERVGIETDRDEDVEESD